MIRISGVNLKPTQQVRFALPNVKGIGKNNVLHLLDHCSIVPTTLVENLADAQVLAIRTYIEENLVVEEDLKRQVKENIARHVRIKTYRGHRHSKGMPVRGQTTRTNSRTVRGNVRKTAGSGKNKSADKT
jgi:small subunit ribosomal protein S13